MQFANKIKEDTTHALMTSIPKNDIHMRMSNKNVNNRHTQRMSETQKAIKTFSFLSFIYLNTIVGIVRVITVNAWTIGTTINCCYKCRLSGICVSCGRSSSGYGTTCVILVIKAIISFIIIIMIVIRCVCSIYLWLWCKRWLYMPFFEEGICIKINCGTKRRCTTI